MTKKGAGFKEDRRKPKKDFLPPFWKKTRIVVSEGEQPDDDAGLGLAAANVESGHEDGSSTGCNK